jgi:ribose-phosphate pyrophosphokinase
MRAAVIGEFKIFAGSANPALAKSIACELGARLGGCVVDRYPDGNVAVELLESVRRKEVFLMQSTSPPASDHLVELLALADACRRAGAGCITAIVPYFGYGRADKHSGRRGPIMARLVADVLQVVGIGHLVMMACLRRRSKAFFIFRWTA